MINFQTALVRHARLFVARSLCAALIAVATAPLSAAANKADAAYLDLVKRVSAGDLSVDFRAFRLTCVKSDNCDPHGDSKRIITMRQALQAKEYAKAVTAAEALIDAGFVNIEAHVICSQAYEGLNNMEKARFHHDVAASLIRSIMATADGKSKETAFEVIGTSEEYVIMGVLGLPPLGLQSLLPGKPNSYDVLEVTDPRTGQKVSVFFNINLFYPPKGFR